MLLHDELQYVIAVTASTTFLQIAEHVFSKSPNMISPNRRTCFLHNRRTRFLQIAEHDFSKSLNMFSPQLPNVISPNRRARFLQIAKHFLIGEQHPFFSVLFGDDPVSDFSLHVLWAPRSALWVVGCGSLVTPVPPTHARAPRSTLWTMG